MASFLCNLFNKSRLSGISVLKNNLRLFHQSPYLVDIPNCSVAEYVGKGFTKYGQLTALIDGKTGSKTTFADLEGQINKTTAGFQSIGLTKSDVVCLFGTNANEFVHTLCGVTSAGGILTIANSQLTSVELSHQLVETNTRYIVTTPDCASRARGAATLCPNIRETIVIGEAEGCRPFHTLQTVRDLIKNVDVNPKEDIALMPYSSGTTGLPKGVQLTHHNLVSQLSQLRHHTILPFIAGSDVSINPLPMVHIAGMMIGLLNPLAQGACVVILPRFEPEPYLSAIETYMGTFSLIAPPLVNFFAKHPLVDKYDLSTLHTPYSGAATLSRSLTEQMVERLHITSIRQGYGMSETTGATHTDPRDGWKYGSIGKPVPNTQCKIVCLETGNPLGADEVGEIMCKGPQVMKGYLNNMAATRETITTDGWIKTGDIGYYDKDGHYFVVDRLKDIIKYKGYQISPTYLESILTSHPAVMESAIVGIPCDELGEVPRAYVVTRSHVTAQELIQHVNDQVSPFKRLRGGVEFVREIPKLPSGKILRRKIRDDISKKTTIIKKMKM
ncbi:probable 4-coumarate--CoA ligase 1 [Mizuhopecten yessoensis]|uniref:4-coumarate--CoA ligase 1 n=1 Tax=Mizuhopecten yessoensis TaxID=6573 RepID=A0A210QME2_MIZYE|nr:probable 4-coumarate--CoA ligase 1 [Mizuhopecten yessoensis]OWF49894.1 4-coumarate--CoA ligase 1 [Mizuhopecten yessoensis]